MDDIFADAATHLVRYRRYMSERCQLPVVSADFLTSDEYAKKQSLYLLLFREIVRCRSESIDESCQKLSVLSICTYGLFRAVVAMDGLIDSSSRRRPSHLALESLLHYEVAIRGLSEALGDDARSTGNLRRLSRLYLSTHHQERAPRPLSEYAMSRLLFRKSCMVLMPLIWARSLYGASRMDVAVRAALIKLFIALQLVDDVRDYREDLGNHQRTLFMYAMCGLLACDPDPSALGRLLDSPEERAARWSTERLHLAMAQRKLAGAADLFRKAGTEVLARCVDLVRVEVARVDAIQREQSP